MYECLLYNYFGIIVCEYSLQLPLMASSPLGVGEGGQNVARGEPVAMRGGCILRLGALILSAVIRSVIL